MQAVINISLIDNGIFGPVVMIDIEINDCIIHFDNWHIEQTISLLFDVDWNSANLESE